MAHLLVGDIAKRCINDHLWSTYNLVDLHKQTGNFSLWRRKKPTRIDCGSACKC